jgi:hypothetical protein
MTALFLSSFQFFHSFGKAFETQPLAPYLLLEVTLGALVVLASVTIVMDVATGRLNSLDLLFFLFPLTWLALSAGFAWLQYDQPLIYGIGEDRRILTFLYWFAFNPVRRKFRLGTADVLLCLTLCACIYLVVAIGLQITVPDRLGSRVIPDFDPRRLRISAPGDCFAICFLSGLVGLLVGSWRKISAVAALVGLAGLIQVAQTRQLTLAAMAAALLIIWILRPAWALVVGLLAAAVFAAIMLIRGPVVFEQLIDALLPNISEFFGANLESNARMRTFGIVTSLLTDNYFFGRGAVSLLYDGGLARLYGRNFFINDVGVFGELFRVGFFYGAFVCAYAAAALRLWQRMSGVHRALVGGIYLFYVLLAPTDGFFYRLGFVHAFLFLLMAAAAAEGRQRRLSAAREIPSQTVALGHA